MLLRTEDLLNRAQRNLISVEITSCGVVPSWIGDSDGAVTDKPVESSGAALESTTHPITGLFFLGGELCPAIGRY